MINYYNDKISLCDYFKVIQSTSVYDFSVDCHIRKKNFANYIILSFVV